jgi:hypothetical protein
MNAQAEELFYEHAVTSLAQYFHQELGIAPNRDYFFRHANAGPRILTLAIGINPKFVPRLKSLEEQLAFVVALESEEQHIRLARGDRGLLYIEIPKPQDLRYTLSLDNLPTGRGVRVPLGLDGFYRPIRMDYEDPLQAHTLIAGTTGSGKTNGLRLLLYYLIKQNGPSEVKLVLLDPSKSGRWFRDFEGLPHLLHPVTTKQDEIAAVLTWALKERDKRSEMFMMHPRIFIALDEAHVILEQSDFVSPVQRLVAEGREVGIHIILVTQKPNVEALGSGRIRDLLTNRVVGCVRDPDEAYRATGRKGSGADLLTKAGDMLFVLPGLCKRGQVPLLTSDAVGDLKDKIGTARNELNLPSDKEIAHILDNDSDEEDDEIANGFSARELAISLIGARYKEKGRPWLKDVLKHELGQAPGSGRAGRLRDAGRELRAELLGYFHDVAPTARLTADR